MGEVLNIFTYSFVIRALICGIAVSVSAAIIGVVLILKKYSMIGHGLGEVGFASMSLALAIGVSPTLVAIPLVLIASFAIMMISQKKEAEGDVTIAMISSGALAIGVIITALTSGFNADVSSYMFGSILSIKTGDVIISVIVSAILMVLYVIFYNRIFMITFDEKYAKSRGINVTFYQFLISFITALVVVIGMRLMGTLLISSLIVFPAIISKRLTKSFKSMVILSAINSVIVFIIGIILSFVLNLPIGASIVVTYLAILGITYVIK